MKKISAILSLKVFLVLTPFTNCSAQIITLIDETTQQPLELATLYSEETPTVSTLSNSKGQANISMFKGAEIIEIRLLGYKPVFISFSQAQEFNYIVKLQKQKISLDEVVVSATRWNQLKNETPAQIVSISPKDVILNNPQTTADMLGATGEVFIQKSQLGGGSPMIRGFAANRVLITVDGIRMNNAIFRSGNLQNIISIDPLTLQHTEILFGPGSVIYGSDAIGGVMNFSTIAPQLSYSDDPAISGNAVARISSANEERTGHLSVNAGWKRWALSTGISWSDFGDLRMGSNGPDEYLRPFYVMHFDSLDHVIANPDPQVQTPAHYQQINLLQKVLFKPNLKWDFTYGFHYSTTSNYDRYDRLIITEDGLPKSAEWYYGPQLWMMNYVEVANHSGNILYDQLIIRAAWQQFEESRHDRTFNKSKRKTRTEQVDALSVNLDFISALDPKNKIFYGAEWIYNEVLSTGSDTDISTGISAEGPSRYPMSDWSSYAAYFSWQHKFSKTLIFQAGTRYNQYVLNAVFDTTFYPFPYTTANINNGSLTGSAGITYNPTGTWTSNLAVSTGFRSPNVDDMGKVFDSKPGAVIVPNPGLEAEYAYNLEAGTSKIFLSTIKLSINAFASLLDNALVRRDYILNGMDSMMYDGEMSKIEAIQNAAQATVYGVQASIEINLPSNWNLINRISYQKGEEELDNGSTSPLRHAAPLYGVTHIIYSQQNLKLDWSVIYNGEISYSEMPEEEQGKNYMYAKDKNGNPYSPAWYTINFKAQYQITENLSVSGGVENITDQRYRPYSSGIVAPGRNFILSLRAGF